MVVRWRLEVADPATGAALTDAVGVLLAVDDRFVTVQTRRGPVRIPRDRVVAAKEVPPRPTRRGAAHLAVSIEDLQRVMVPSWGAVERAEIGDWVLRASSGFTQRGNSTVPVGDPGVALPTAVDLVEDWYAARRLPAKFALAGPVGFDPARDVLGRELVGRGYTAATRTTVMTASTDAIIANDPGGPQAVVSERLDQVWLEIYRGTRETLAGATEAVLTGSPRQLFGRIERDRRPVAVARLGFGEGWAGLGAVWTDPDERGRGLAAHLTAELARHAAAGGIRLVHLQVEQDNSRAQGLYERLGFQTHSAYAYLTSALA